MCRVPLNFTHELDPYTRKDLKPFLYQTPSLYDHNHLLNGLITVEGKIFVIDTFGALYETQKEKKFEPFESRLIKEDKLSFSINEEVKFTYDLLNVQEVYDALV